MLGYDIGACDAVVTDNRHVRGHFGVSLPYKVLPSVLVC